MGERAIFPSFCYMPLIYTYSLLPARALSKTLLLVLYMYLFQTQDQESSGSYRWLGNLQPCYYDNSIADVPNNHCEWHLHTHFWFHFSVNRCTGLGLVSGCWFHLVLEWPGPRSSLALATDVLLPTLKSLILDLGHKDHVLCCSGTWR